MGFSPQVTQGFGDIFDLGQSQQTDGEVAQAGHHLGAFPFSDLCTVLVESHISYIVRTIFNRPLPSNVRKHLFRISLLDGEAGQTEEVSVWTSPVFRRINSRRIRNT